MLTRAPKLSTHNSPAEIMSSSCSKCSSGNGKRLQSTLVGLCFKTLVLGISSEDTEGGGRSDERILGRIPCRRESVADVGLASAGFCAPENMQTTDMNNDKYSF